ncbi:VPLPA-CTERM sorting domain-containing protein [Methylocaldum sp.]|uniref:VPLPA-CTERM sorting domain-containing protein n=1 Tax=Methylocaldum sp. TaxID=1969727 RepID=UPI002D517C5A|nr:VPLPA-CTERM sorting domain-containing protein [Methylocaldum sp.]HYE35115.1 VPLPA-CTERM sorting domain-containing protein [Methylocaldum sp.]
MFKLKTFIPPLAVLSLGLAWAPAHAQSWSSELADITLVEGDLGALGEPVVITDDTGVNLNFRPDPLTFQALSMGSGQVDNGTNGPIGTGQVDAETVGFTLKVTAAPNHFITGVTWSNEGVYQVTGEGTGVSAFASLRVADPETLQTIGDTQAETFSAFGANDGTDGSPWDLTVSQSLASGPLEIDLTVKDILAAFAPENGFAWIEKDFGGLSVDVALIPLPASVWLLGTALSALITIGRRRQATA